MTFNEGVCAEEYVYDDGFLSHEVVIGKWNDGAFLTEKRVSAR